MVEHILTAPIPPFQNLPPEPQFYQPSRFVISGVTLGQTTVVSSASTMNYVIGQLVRLIIPRTFGCRQLNEQTGYVLSLPSSTSVQISLNSVGADPYIAAPSPTQAQIIAVGDINNGYQASNGIANNPPNIPGSFNNISPV